MIPTRDTVGLPRPLCLLHRQSSAVVGEGGAGPSGVSGAAESAPERAPSPSALRILLVFAGRATDSHALLWRLREQGHQVTPIDTRLGGASHDVLRGDLGRRLQRGVVAGEYDLVFAAPPCSSFSVRHPARLRSWARPWGVSPLPAGWEAYVQLHNRLADFTAELVRACHIAGVPCAVENPADRSERASPAYWEAEADSGSIWRMPALRAALEQAGAVHYTFAQCSPLIGGRAQKYTTIAAVGTLRPELAVLRACGCTHGRQRHDERLEGYDEYGRSRATQAAAYPAGLNRLLAESFERAAPRARALREAAAEADAWAAAPGAGDGRLSDGPALDATVAAACETARHVAISFASPRRREAAPRAELRRTAMPCDPSLGMLPTARPGGRGRLLARRGLRRRGRAARRREPAEPLPPEAAGETLCGECEPEGSGAADAPAMRWARSAGAGCGLGGVPAAARAQLARGPVRIEELYLEGVYEREVRSWLRLADAAAAAIRRGETPPHVETRVIEQAQMAPFARGLVWDCSDPSDCRPVRRSTRDTAFPGARQLDRAAVRRVAAELDWVDTDIIDQIGEGGVETRAGCELITVLAFHHQSLLAEVASAEATVAAHAAEDWVSAPTRDLPFVPCRLQPRGVVLQARSRVREDGVLEDYMKPRITTDGSFGGPDSVNAGVTDVERAVGLPSAQTFGVGWAVCQSAFDGEPEAEGGGTGVAGYCVDAESAYSFCPVQQADLWQQCFVWWDAAGSAGFRVDRRMGFGGAFAPNRFERVSTFVAAYAQRLQAEFDAQQPLPRCAARWAADRAALQAGGALPHGPGQLVPRYLQVFIDDFCGCAAVDAVVPPPEVAGIIESTAHMAAAGCQPPPRTSRAFVHAQLTVLALRRLGLAAAPQKVMVGSPLTALGLSFDASRRVIECPEGKRVVVLAACAEALQLAESENAVAVRSAERLVGRLCSLSQVCPDLRPLLAGGYAVTRAPARHGGRLRLRSGGAAWRGWVALLTGAARALEGSCGVAMAPRRELPGRDVLGSMTVVADASGDDGVGGYAWAACSGEPAVVVSEEWPDDLRAALAASADVDEAELRRAGSDEAAAFLPTAAAEVFGQLLVARVAARELGRPDLVYGVCDCSSAVAALNELHGRSDHMAALAARAAACGWTWLGVAVPRTLNFDADRLSHPALVETVIEEARLAGVAARHVRADASDWAVLREVVAEVGRGATRRRKRRRA